MRFDLRERLLALESRYGDSRLAPSEITDLVRKCIKDAHVKVSTRRHSKADPGQVIPGGSYDSDDDSEQMSCIHLDLIYHPDQQHLEIKYSNWDRVCFEICEVIGHEYVHRDQHRRKFRNEHYPCTLEPGHPDRAQQIYHGEACEIEAYGYSIAAEVLVYYNGEEEAAHLTETYQLYARLFETDQSVILKLDQYISKYLNKLKAVKDVKTTTTTRRSRTRD
jgi:hypothetical protein